MMRFRSPRLSAVKCIAVLGPTQASLSGSTPPITPTGGRVMARLLEYASSREIVSLAGGTAPRHKYRYNTENSSKPFINIPYE